MKWLDKICNIFFQCRMNGGLLGGGGSFYDELFGGGGAMTGGRMRYRRDVMEDMKDGVHTVEDEVIKLEEKAEDLLEPVAEKTHMKPW